MPPNRPMPKKGPPARKKALRAPVKRGERSQMKNPVPTKRIPPKIGAPYTRDKGVELKPPAQTRSAAATEVRDEVARLYKQQKA